MIVEDDHESSRLRQNFDSFVEQFEGRQTDKVGIRCKTMFGNDLKKLIIYQRIVRQNFDSFVKQFERRQTDKIGIRR
jgi:DNA mismatch repair ATPase MutS